MYIKMKMNTTCVFLFLRGILERLNFDQLRTYEFTLGHKLVQGQFQLIRSYKLQPLFIFLYAGVGNWRCDVEKFASLHREPAFHITCRIITRSTAHSIYSTLHRISHESTF